MIPGRRFLAVAVVALLTPHTLWCGSLLDGAPLGPLPSPADEGLARALHEAVKAGALEEVERLLDRNPALLDARGDYQRTPLIAALFAHKPDVARLLIERGAGVNLDDLDAFTPLALAAAFGEREIAQRLVASGARVDAVNRITGMTALHFAVRAGRTELVRFLLEKGAGLEWRSVEGDTPLALAVTNGHAEIVSALLDAGAPVDARDELGSTPLVLAAAQGREDLVDILLARGADVEAKNRLGGTPASVAAREGHRGVLGRLTAGGARAPAEPPRLPAGPYLGQKPPGLTPKWFAPGFVSTEKHELNAVFTLDGREFYYAVNRGPMRWTIYVVKRQEAGWSRPEVASFSGEYSDVDLFLSPDGRRLYYASNRPLEAAAPPKQDFDIWMVERSGEAWSAPRRLEEPVNSEVNEFYPAVTRDGSLYFQSMRPGGHGSGDIYVARLEQGRYHQALNLGEPINGPAFESDAYVSPDETLLVYSTTRAGGLGQGDLYVSSRQADGTWATPRNLGPSINTAAHENCPMLSPDGKYFFFTRSGNVYWVDAAALRGVP